MISEITNTNLYLVTSNAATQQTSAAQNQTVETDNKVAQIHTPQKQPAPTAQTNTQSQNSDTVRSVTADTAPKETVTGDLPGLTEVQNDEPVIYEPSSLKKEDNTDYFQEQKEKQKEELESEMDVNKDGVVTIYEMMEYLQNSLNGQVAQEVQNAPSAPQKVTVMDASNAINAFKYYQNEAEKMISQMPQTG